MSGPASCGQQVCTGSRPRSTSSPSTTTSWAGALGAFGWIGRTTLLVSLPGAERLYPVRGRDTLLLDFAEALSERLMLLKR